MLKKAIAVAFLKEHAASNADISLWKGQDITIFQEALQAKVHSSISEKSFYSYFKNTPQKLPRIDSLNLLSQYCGYTNWNDFKSKQETIRIETKKSSSIYYLWIGVGILSIVAIFLFSSNTTNTFTFCFMDQDRNQPITKTPIHITILNDTQSPFYTESDSLGCFQWKTTEDFIRFVIQSPYHKTDTIYRKMSASNEHIKVKTDDYALMLHYYANGKVTDWKNRKKELEHMIADDAIIFQVLPYGLGIEMFTKKEWIRKLTTPTKSLRNIEIIAATRTHGKIVKLKFKVKSATPQ